MTIHENLRVPLEVVTDLVRAQFPQWAELVIAPVESEGTVNAILRIGEEMAARFPLQGGHPDEIRQWLRSEADAALGTYTQADLDLISRRLSWPPVPLPQLPPGPTPRLGPGQVLCGRAVADARRTCPRLART